MDPAESTVEQRNQTHGVDVIINKSKGKVLSARSLSSTSAHEGVNHFGREVEGTEVIVPSKKRKPLLPLQLPTRKKARLGVRLLNEKDIDRAADVIVKTCPSFEIVLGPICLVSKKDARALENALRNENIPAERVMVTFTDDLTPVIHSMNGRRRRRTGPLATPQGSSL